MRRLATALILIVLGLATALVLHLNYCPKTMYSFWFLFWNEPQAFIKQLIHLLAIPSRNDWYGREVPENLWISSIIYIFLYLVWIRGLYLIGDVIGIKIGSLIRKTK